MKSYTRPILTGVFYILGTLSVFTGIYLLVVGLRTGQRDLSMTGVGTIVGGLMQLGLGQAVDFLGRAAYYAEMTARAMVPEPEPEPVVDSSQFRAMLP